MSIIKLQLNLPCMEKVHCHLLLQCHSYSTFCTPSQSIFE